jgi:hypothetical protein
VKAAWWLGLVWLVPALCLGVVRLPSPVEWDAPSGAPAAPGDTFPVTFPEPTVPVAAGAPVIAEWNRGCVKPDESFTMTGANLAPCAGGTTGVFTTVWVWSDDGAGGALRQASVWSAKDYLQRPAKRLG